MAKDKTVTFAVLCFIHAWTFSVDSKTKIPQHGLINNSTVHNNPLDNAVPRDMAPNIVNDDYKGSRPEMHKKGSPDEYDPKTINLSVVKEAVDDMHDGCNEQTKVKVKEYLKKEKNQNPFKDSWDEAEKCLEKVNERFKNDREKFNNTELEDDHIKAICAYTADKPQIYVDFNEAVRTQKEKYKTKAFLYHTLHFWLTDAVRLLNQKESGCITSYRRTKDKYIGKVNQEMRFGYFASSSLDENSNKIFGGESCFEIFTCFGAYLESYPFFGNRQKEVLIPPYEVFKITAVSKKEKKEKKEKKKKDNSLWCNTVYKLNSTKKPLSNLNCKLVPHSAENNL